MSTSSIRNVVAILTVAFLAIGARPALASWNADTTLGLGVCMTPGDVIEPIAVTDSAGGVLVLWTDFRRPGFDPDLYIRRVTANGDTLWDPNGTAVCNVVGSLQHPTMIPDGHGGAFVAWFDFRASGQGYYAQHIRSDGSAHWTPNGVKIGNLFNSQFGPKICRDTLGGVFVAYASASPGTLIQRLDSLGVKRLSAFGSEAPVLRGNPSAPLAIEPDGNGGAIVALGYGTTSSLGNLATQRATENGSMLWVAGGAVVRAVGAGGALAPDMVADGSGGAILAWNDTRLGFSRSDIYAQRVSSSGVTQWTANGIAVCAQDTTQDQVQLEPFADGTVVATWVDRRHAPLASIYAQRIGPDGSFQWAMNGVRVSSALDINRYTLVRPRGDHAILSWSTGFSYGGDVFAQKVDGTGVRLWGDVGATVCRGPNDQTYNAAVGDGLGGVFVAYRDRRDPNDPDLFASHLGADGLPGTVVGVFDPPTRSMTVLTVAPNPASGAQLISFARPLGVGARVDVFDVRGRRRVSRALPLGIRSWTWDGIDDRGHLVEAGYYWVRASDGTSSPSGRVMRLR